MVKIECSTETAKLIITQPTHTTAQRLWFSEAKVLVEISMRIFERGAEYTRSSKNFRLTYDK